MQNLLPQSLHSVAQCSVSIIDNASSSQIDAAIKHNQNTINTLLVKLLAVNFINQKKDKIIQDVKQMNHDHTQEM